MSTKDCALTQKYLKECFSYNTETGILMWLERPRSHFKTSTAFNTFNKRFSGKNAGSKTTTTCGKTYSQVRVSNKLYFSQRIIWTLVHNEIPNEIDHINGDSEDNKLVNLRNVTHKENQKNLKLSSKNTSGLCGVEWDKGKNKWRARITINKIKFHLGYFLSKQSALNARVDAENKYNFHPNHGLSG